MSMVCLTICPRSPDIRLTENELLDVLRKLELAGERCSLDTWSNEVWYGVGRNFSRYFVFTQHDDFFNPCAIQLKIREHRGVITSTYVDYAQPRCPKCSFEYTEHPADLINLWWGDQEQFQYTCPSCGENMHIWEMDWREMTGFGRCEIYFQDLNPGYCAIQPSLFDDLKRETNFDWVPVWQRY